MSVNIGTGNTKLGNITTWSIPAGNKYSCPGETKECRAACYAKAGRFMLPSVKKSLLHNFKESKKHSFVYQITNKLKAEKVKILRLHVSGDFYNTEYIKKWIEIVKLNPEITFYAYTRSWRLPELKKWILKLAKFPNVTIWFSADKSAPPNDTYDKWAYMATDDEDAFEASTKYHDKIGIIFRTSKSTIKKYVNGILVCPAENGIKSKMKITCEKCGLCWDKRKPSPYELKKPPENR